MGRGGDGEVVGDHDESGAVALLDLGEDFENLCGVDAVEVAGGLVGEENLGLVDEGAGDGNTLTLTGGELCGVLVEAMLEAELGEERAGSFFAVARVAAGAREVVRRRAEARRGTLKTVVKK